MTDRSHPRVRKWSLLLSSLSLSPDSALESFRERRATDPRLPVERLRKAQALLDAVAQAIESTDEGRWSRLEQAHALLARDAPFDSSVSDGSHEQASARSADVASTGHSAATRDELIPTSSPAREAAAPSSLPRPDFTAANLAEEPRLDGASPPASGSPLAPSAVVSAAGSSPWSPRSVQAPTAHLPTEPASSPPQGLVAAISPQVVVEQPDPLTGIDTTGEMSVLRAEPELPFLPSSTGGALGLHRRLPSPGVLGSGMPFSRSSRDGLSGPTEAAEASALTVEQFASFVVERERYPANLDAVRARYGVATVRAEADLDRQFADRLRRDQAARRAYEEARARYQAWLDAQG